jgi:hypothetical protein
MHRRLPALLIAAAAPLLVTGAASPAAAVTAQVAPAASVPDCVLTIVDDDGGSDFVVVTNACRRSVRVQVVIDNYPDDACVTIAPTKSRSFDWFYPGRFAGLKRC